MYFLFNDTTTTKIYTLSLHDALPISDEFSNEACQKMKESVKLIGGEFARKGARMRCYEEVRQYRAVSRAHRRRVCSGASRVSARCRANTAASRPTRRYSGGGNRDRLKHSDRRRGNATAGLSLKQGRDLQARCAQCH